MKCRRCGQFMSRSNNHACPALKVGAGRVGAAYVLGGAFAVAVAAGSFFLVPWAAGFIGVAAVIIAGKIVRRAKGEEG